MTTAARLQQLADPGEALLDDATVRAAEPRIGADPVGTRLLRGQSHPIVVHHLRDERRRARNVSRQSIRFVGRQDERRRLAEMIRRTAETGRGGAVLVDGAGGGLRLDVDRQCASSGGLAIPGRTVDGRLAGR
jgi:hypothetical protein